MDTLSMTVHELKKRSNFNYLCAICVQIKNEGLFKNLNLTEMGNTGFEPVTSCLSSKRSKPTELIAHIIWDYKCSLISNNFFMKNIIFFIH